jgi:DNA topoisomerase-1
MNYNFTAEIEKKFDVIADGDIKWKSMIKKFYEPFQETVEDTTKNAERAKGRRDLGVDPETGHTVLAQMARFGPVVQKGTVEEVGEEGKPVFASLLVGQSISTITYEEAMELFKLPKSLGEYEGEDVVVNRGRFGPYVKFKEWFISIPKDEDPMEVTLARAGELIEEKKKAEAPVGHYEGKPYTKGKGRFGPFLKWEGKFVNIPRRFDPENLTTEEEHQLIAAKIEKDAKKFIHMWPEEKINVENGRWGPYIKFKKKNVKITKVDDGEGGERRITYEEGQALTLEEVKAIILAEDPTAFGKPKKKAAKKKPAAKKKKAPAKKK